jgi:hypothetical protein
MGTSKRRKQSSWGSPSSLRILRVSTNADVWDFLVRELKAGAKPGANP